MADLSLISSKAVSAQLPKTIPGLKADPGGAGDYAVVTIRQDQAPLPSDAERREPFLDGAEVKASKEDWGPLGLHLEERQSYAGDQLFRSWQRTEGIAYRRGSFPPGVCPGAEGAR